MKLGILTGGGDCPGLNCVIRAVTVVNVNRGTRTIGVRRGWKGFIDGDFCEVTPQMVAGIHSIGGTILGSSRANPARDPGLMARLSQTWHEAGLDGLIAIGGDDTLSVAEAVRQMGLKVISVPKTIDNDIGRTDYSFGFHTAASVIVDAMDRLRTTAEAHDRIIVLEVMGRHSGWLATYAGLAGGADLILVPEKPFDLDEVVSVLQRRFERGRFFACVVVAEGAKPKGFDKFVTRSKEVDEFGHVQLGGVGEWLAQEINSRMGKETRAVILGHIQRGGSPVPFDRVLATRLGVRAAELAHEGVWGVMVALRGLDIVTIPLREVKGRVNELREDFYQAAQLFFG
ncbi:MAG: ATP-dependent 6-phosphofructokinase [Candidatus Tectomicrobia bacterium]|uniref:Pyrophosphate--fructose 6-phosphate 1-phosphotransferase n=1 Tax=Tectimicrobiota bacterium TaxID=2528274 RepID=A0A932I3Q9_UNCTE|nr:ATP-dependent 6-phosphofructokinase [Candidatus Tectomicrobia bacterium]